MVQKNSKTNRSTIPNSCFSATDRYIRRLDIENCFENSFQGNYAEINFADAFRVDFIEIMKHSSGLCITKRFQAISINMNEK